MGAAVECSGQGRLTMEDEMAPTQLPERIEAAVLSRRAVLLGGLASVPVVLAACRGGGGDDRGAGGAPTTQGSTEPATATTLAPTPACTDSHEATPSQTEGPFFTPDSPEKPSFLADVDGGTRIVVTGTVLTTACQPAAGALLDVWHADDRGDYDNQGYRLRGHQFAGADGAYRLETIVPATYAVRTRHIHFKVQAEGGPLLTTQLYFPDEPGNEDDDLFNAELLMDVRDGADGKEATFNFVVET
jgi:protocatechuate 3,4-dioxygenase beta subunit